MRVAWGIVVVLALVLLALAFGAFHFDQTTIPFGRVKFIPMPRLGSASDACDERMRLLDAIRAGEYDSPAIPRGVLAIPTVSPGGPMPAASLNLGVLS